MRDRTTHEPQALHDVLLRLVTAANRRGRCIARILSVTDTDLAAIEHLDSRGELSPTRLADALDLSSGGVAIVIKRLERGGHVVRRAHPIDARRALVTLSESTARRYGELTATLARELHEEVMRASPAARSGLRRLLRDVADIMEAQAEQLRTDADQAEPVTPVPSVPSLWQ